MSKKKKFTVPNTYTSAISETIKMAETAVSYYNTLIELSRIEVDPTNPRKLELKPIDLKTGLKESGPSYITKQKELEELKLFSKSIAKEGLLHPIICYKKGDGYRIVAGERRYLAHLLLNKERIEARVFHEKPTGYTLKYVQWLENNERKDLHLYNKILNLKELVKLYESEHPSTEMSINLLAELSNLSYTQASQYYRLLTADNELLKAIQEKHVNNIDKAAFLVSITNARDRRSAISQLQAGKDFRQVKKDISIVGGTKKKKIGRKRNSILLGKTKNLAVVKHIINNLAKLPPLDQYTDQLSNINWDSYEDTTKAFASLLQMLEKNINKAHS